MATAPPQPEPPKVWMFVSKVRQYFPSVFQNRNLSWPKQGQGTNDWGGDLTDRPALLAPLRGSAAWSPWQTMARPSPTTKRSQRPRDLRSPFPGALRGGSSLVISICQNNPAHELLWVQAAGHMAVSLPDHRCHYPTITLQNQSQGL